VSNNRIGNWAFRVNHPVYVEVPYIPMPRHPHHQPTTGAGCNNMVLREFATASADIGEAVYIQPGIIRSRFRTVLQLIYT